MIGAFDLALETEQSAAETLHRREQWMTSHSPTADFITIGGFDFL